MTAQVRTTFAGGAKYLDAEFTRFRPTLDWPESFPVPPVGAEVNVDDTVMYVRTVVYYALGDEGTPEPFVYVVLVDTP